MVATTSEGHGIVRTQNPFPVIARRSAPWRSSLAAGSPGLPRRPAAVSQ